MSNIINYIYRHMWLSPRGRSTAVRNTSLSLMLSTLSAFLVILGLRMIDEMRCNHSVLAHTTALGGSKSTSDVISGSLLSPYLALHTPKCV
jgi:hypothetical protein